MKKNLSAFRHATVILLLTSGASLTAQDFHLSQYDAAPMYLNPSMCGMFTGFYRIHANYRTQWNQITMHPFTTGAIGFDMPLKKISWGAQVMNNHAGTGGFNEFSFMGTVSYDHGFGQKKYHHAAIGAQVGFWQKSVDMNKLVFDNQYVTTNGGNFDPSLPNGELLSYTNSFVFPDINAGAMYYYGKQESRINPFLGFSAFHLTQPNESFFSATNKLPIRTYVHGGTWIGISEKIQLAPKFILMREAKAKELTVSLLMHYYLKSSDAFIIFGPTYRISGALSKANDVYPKEKDAAVIELGLKMGKYTYRVSYDINTSTLQPYTKGHGAFEVSVVYIAKRQKPNPVLNCPRI